MLRKLLIEILGWLCKLVAFESKKSAAAYTPSIFTQKINSSNIAVKFFRRKWDKNLIGEREQVYIIVVNDQNQELCTEHLHTGSSDRCPIEPKLVFKYILMHDGTGFFLAHNHTNKSLIPTPYDIDVTEKIKGLADELEIRFLDHIIITHKDDYSFEGGGLLN